MPQTNSPVPVVNPRWLLFWRLVLAEEANLTRLQTEREARQSEPEVDTECQN